MNGRNQKTSSQYLTKKPISNKNGGDDAAKIRYYPTRSRMANMLDADRAKVDRQHVKGGLSAALHN